MVTSPFPGMDPFLEDGAEWSTVHAWLIPTLAEQLAAQVSPHFSVKIEQRIYMATSDEQRQQTIIPDVYIIRESPKATERYAAATITPPVLVEPTYEPLTRHRYIEIRDKQNRALITTIELLSPFNKSPGTQGRNDFMEKRRTVMQSDVHWVEIDLLRAGERPNEVAHKSDYYALLKRGGAFGPFEVWYFDLRDRLPTIAIPLRPPFADVPLDLQAAFALMYERAHYADDIDYTGKVPPPALRPADAHWVAMQLETWRAPGQMR
ncbi:MAG: DUF4058 family protein [Caldilineaceae bacterium]